MEYFDIVDEDGNPTGGIVSREKAHKEGIPHRTSHVWIVRETEKGYDILLQKRSPGKDSYPGMYDTSSAGHISSGDEPAESAVRELREELGIRAEPSRLEYIGKFHRIYSETFHGSLFKDHEISFVFLFHGAVDTEQISLQEDEVEEVRWFDLESVRNEIQRSRERFCVPQESLDLLRKHLCRKTRINRRPETKASCGKQEGEYTE